MRKLRYKIEPFKAHITVARVVSPEAKERVREGMKKFAKTKFGACAVNKVVLFKSTLTPNGPVYEPVHTKKLA
jgi:2'-5' RNA ligase